jgi:hypothetical protein
MMGRVLTAKYADPGSSIFNVKINNTLITNTLIDLGATINAMMCETMETLGLTNLRETQNVLQLAHRSIIKPVGLLEDVVIFVDSWE